MKKLTLVTIVLLGISASMSAQTYHHVKDLGMDWFGSRIYPSGSASWIVHDNGSKDTLPSFWRLHDRWRLTPFAGGGRMPFRPSHTKAMAFSDQQGWVGTYDKIAFTTDYSTWNVIDISEPGREVSITALSLYEGGVGVIATLTSYVITKLDTMQGSLVKWTSQRRSSIVLITPTDRTVLYRDSGTSREPYTNVVQASASTFAVGFGSDMYSMMILHLDGTVQYINRPDGTRAGPAVHLHGTANDDYYCFYGPSDSPTGSIGPSAVVYHNNNGSAEYIDLKRIGYIKQATSSDGLVVGAVYGGLAVIKGTSARLFRLTDTSYGTAGEVYPNAMDVYGVEFVNPDTLICNSQSKLVVIPRDLLTTTSVEAPSPGRTLGAASSSHLIDIVDGTQEVVWSVFDNTGRAVLAGTMSVGQRDIRLPLEGVSSGVYHLQLTGDGRIIRTQTLLKAP